MKYLKRLKFLRRFYFILSYTMSLKKSIIVIILILLIDQISKIYIKTHFALGDEYKVFDWFRVYFVENDGMAWGTKLSDFTSFISDRTAKIALTIFRIIAIIGIGFWLLDATRKKSPKVLLLAIAFIFAGALGNIIDSVFYGLLFNDSHGQIASFCLLKEAMMDYCMGV